MLPRQGAGSAHTARCNAVVVVICTRVSCFDGEGACRASQPAQAQAVARPEGPAYSSASLGPKPATAPAAPKPKASKSRAQLEGEERKRGPAGRTSMYKVCRPRPPEADLLPSEKRKQQALPLLQSLVVQVDRPSDWANFQDLRWAWQMPLGLSGPHLLPTTPRPAAFPNLLPNLANLASETSVTGCLVASL